MKKLYLFQIYFFYFYGLKKSSRNYESKNLYY